MSISNQAPIEVKHRIKNVVEVAKHLGAVAAATIGIGGAGYMTFAPSKLDIVGNYGRLIPKEEATNDAMRQFDATFVKQSPRGKFMLQYLSPTVITMHDRASTHGLLGVLQSFGIEKLHQATINTNCLAHTVFDPTADTPAYLSAGSENKDILTVQPTNPDAPALHFRGLESGTELMPLDTATIAELRNNGCHVGLTDYRTISKD